jgi:hypothetical protein
MEVFSERGRETTGSHPKRATAHPQITAFGLPPQQNWDETVKYCVEYVKKRIALVFALCAWAAHVGV